MPEKTLGEYVEQVRGVAYSPNDLSNSNEGFPLLRATNIKGGALSFENLVFVNKKAVKQEQMLKIGDVLICASSGSRDLVGKAGVFRGNEAATFGAFCKVIRIRDSQDIEKEYLRWFFFSRKYRNLISQASLGSNIHNIKSKDISNIFLNIPSLDTQKEAVKSFDLISKAILVKKKEQESLISLIKSRFIEMFGIQDLSPQLPSWKLSKELAQIATGTTPTTTDSSNWDGSILWITPAEMKEDSFVITNTERKLSEKGMRSKSLSLMPIGTVLLSTRAPIGKVGIVGKEMCCNQGFKNFIFKKGVIDPVFAFWLFKMSSDYLESIGHGTTFKEISKTNAENIRIPTPPFVDQVAFSTFAKEIDKSGFVNYSKYFL